MISVAEARQIAGKRLHAKLSISAAQLCSSEPEPQVVVLPLAPPTEKVALLDIASAQAWARGWQDIERAGSTATVSWEDRAWRAVGRQRIPVRLTINGADQLAEFSGGEAARSWRKLSTRARSIANRFEPGPSLATAMKRHASGLLSYSDDEFQNLLDVVEWLCLHDVKGLRPRQLPVRGIDTKWFSSHRSVVTSLHEAVTGQVTLGIADADPLVRVRILDGRIAPAGLSDFSAPVRQLDALPIEPDRVLIFENLESLLALPPWPGTVAVHGSGYAVSVAAKISWVAKTPVLYWGDIDTDGFAILHKLRSAHRDVISVLMDEETLLQGRDLWVSDPSPNQGEFETLTGSEKRALNRVRIEGNVRLEQERIPWDIALAALQAAATP